MSYLAAIADYFKALFTSQAFKAHWAIVVGYIAANVTPDMVVSWLHNAGYDVPYQVVAMIFALVLGGGVYAIQNKN